MSNYPGHRPFFYNLFSAFRPYAARQASTTSVTASSAIATSHAFSSTPTNQAQASSHPHSHLSPPPSPTGPHAQITQAATARAIAAKPQPSTSGFAQAAAAFSPPSRPPHHSSHHHSSPPHTTAATAKSRAAPGATVSPYSPSSFGGRHPRNRRGSDSSSDNEGFMQKPGGEKWFIGGKMGNTGEERFYQLSLIRRERSNDRRSCDRMSL